MADDVTVPTYTLNDSTPLRPIGFGTLPLNGSDGIAAIESSLDVGYRMPYTAVNYENPIKVAKALRCTGLPREEVQFASKLPGRHHAYDKAIAAVRVSLQ